MYVRSDCGNEHKELTIASFFCVSPSLSRTIGWLVIYDGCMWTFGMVSNILIPHASPSAYIAMHDIQLPFALPFSPFFLVDAFALYDTDIAHCLIS